MQEHSEPDRSGYVQCPGYDMPGAVVVFECVDSLLRPYWHMAADFCGTGINSVILVGIYGIYFSRNRISLWLSS